MMASLNRVTLIGNLTRDPELRYTKSGMAMVKFGLAMNRKYKSGNDWKEDVTFVDITVWGKQAENCSQYLNKGRSVCIEGRITFSQWEKDGEKRSNFAVTAERVVFLGSKQYNDPGPTERPDDDVPF